MSESSGNDRAGRSRAIVRRGVVVVSASLASGLVAIVLLLAGARWLMPETIAGPVADAGWTARSRAWFTTEGFFPPEVDRDSSRNFSWTRGSARLVVPNLDRSQPYRLTLQIAPGRPAGVPPPFVRLAVDGVVVVTTEPSNDRRNMVVEIPSRHASGAEVTLDVSNTFVPGPNDKRSLGVVVEDIGVAPAAGHFRPSSRVLMRAGLAVVLTVLGALLCGFHTRLGSVSSSAVTFAFTWLLLQDGAFIGSYVDRLVNVGIGVAIAGSVVALLRWRWPSIGGLAEWPIAVGLVLTASAVKLALFAHPLATVGDAIFQVHRAQYVHAGTYFFTSVTPRPFFEFPYAIALYVAAQPFWQFFPAQLDLVRLLRGLSLGADALVGISLYAVTRRQWKSPQAALLCAALWPLARAPLEALNNANLTNVFGQGLFGVAMCGIAWIAAGTRMPIAAWAVTLGFLIAAFLSHFSTVSVGVPILCAVGVMLMASGRGHARRVGALALAVTIVAAATSYVVYYSHFNAIYAKTLARVVSGEGEAPTRSIVAPPAVKAQRWLAGQADDYGLPSLPVLVIAAAGAVLLARKRPREGLTVVLAGWALVWVGFSALGIFSPLAMRVNLAAAPVFTCLAACALGDVAARSRIGIALALAGAVVVGWDGLRVCLIAVGLAPPW